MSILLLATGGTIASTVQADGSVQVSLSGSELLDTVHDLDRSNIDIVDMGGLPSWNFDAATMERIARRAAAALDSGAATGVVVTHGTDSLEETLFLTDLLARRSTAAGPIVFTGAMHNASSAEPDGPANLRDAFAVAASPEASDRGAMLCVNGQLHGAWWVTKTHTSAINTFRSPVIEDAIGYVIEGQPMFQSPRPDAPTYAIADAIDTAVTALPSYGGLPASTIDWLVEQGAHGIVIEATGAGNVNATLVPGIERAVSGGIPVVVTSRCREGSVGRVYGGPGGGHSLGALGVIHAGDLSVWKARLALMVALGADAELDAVRRWFAALLGESAA